MKYNTLKILVQRARAREIEATKKTKLMNYLIVALCLIIIFSGVTGCVGFNG